MAKNVAEDKGFKAGLESLFQEAWKEDGFEEKSILLSDIKAAPKKKRKNSSSKNFTDSFNALFEEAFEETVDEKIKELKHGSQASSKPINSTTNTGIDQLIKSTIETSRVEINEVQNKKRVTFVFDRDKLDKLKQIARLEKTYLKDIINDVVASFIQEYEQQLE